MSMNKKLPPLEVALIKKIEDGEGSVYQMMILAHEYGVGMGKIEKILKKHIKNNKILWLGNKFIIQNITNYEKSGCKGSKV